MDLFQIMSSCEDLMPIIKFLKHGVLPIFQIGVPIILIVMGTIDLGRAVLSSDDKEIKAGTSRLIKRAIAAIFVFFVATIVTIVMNLFADSGASNNDNVKGTDSWGKCWGQA